FGMAQVLAELESEWKGLPESQVRQALQETVEAGQGALEERVHEQWDGLAAQLNTFLKERTEEYSRRIEEELMEGWDQELRAAFDGECERLGLDLERVPALWKQELMDGLAGMGERLRREGRGKRITVARNEWERDLARVQELHAQRHYEEAMELWSDRLASPWRVSVFPQMERELREASLMQGVLERAARSLSEAHDQPILVNLREIQQTVTLVECQNPLERGVAALGGARRDRITLLLRRDTGGVGEVLVPGDVLGLADAVPEDPEAKGLPYERELARALFLYHEGDLHGAQAALPKGEAHGDPLTLDLERRILRGLTEGEIRTPEQWIVILAALTRDVESGGQACRRAGTKIEGLLS
ncbi:MAG: hypothetical protein KDB61_15205, partial [Planctomycetes bacterium]|nr:hypothetical protein [Planctomycetota bacterium]